MTAIENDNAILEPGAKTEIGSPILFFDGVCGLCNRFIDFAIVRDRHRRLLFAPLQGETAAARLPIEDRDQLDTVVFLIDHQTHRRSAAIVRVLWQLGILWKFIGTLLWIVPWPLRDIGYRMVSKSRYRFFGKKEACRLPTPEERDRFRP